MRRVPRPVKILVWAALALVFVDPILSFAATTIPGIGTSGAGKPVWTLYTIGAGPALYGLLLSIKTMVAQGSYKEMLLFVCLIGFLVNASAAMIRAQPHRLATATLLIVFVSYMAFNLRVNIQIDDEASNYVNVVTGVPAVVGLPAAMISQIGHYLTYETEQDFQIPGFGALELTNGGLFNMSAEVVSALNTPVINDLPLRSSFDNYFNDCVVPALANGTIPVQAIGLASPGTAGHPPLIKALAAAGSQALMTNSYLLGGTPTTMSCNTAYNLIKMRVQSSYPQLLTQTMGQAYQVYGASGAAANLYATAITSGFNWLNGNNGAPSAQDMVIQSAMMSLVRSGFAYSAAQTGTSPVVDSVNLQQAYKQQQSSWWAASQLFAKIGPMFYVVLYAFVVGLAPFIIIGLFIPRLGGMMAVSYFQILVWLALWQPAFSILNYIMALFEQNSSTEIMVNTGVWSFQSHAVLNQAAQNYILVGGFLATLTPMILFALVKSGSMAFTGFLEAASSKSAAVAAGNSMASGNLSLGNESIDNTNMNKYNLTRTASVGMDPVTLNLGAGATNWLQHESGTAADIAGVKSTHSQSVTSSAAEHNVTQQGSTLLHDWGTRGQALFQEVNQSARSQLSKWGAHISTDGRVTYSTDNKHASEIKHLVNSQQQIYTDLTGKTTQTASEGYKGSIKGGILFLGEGAEVSANKGNDLSHSAGWGAGSKASAGRDSSEGGTRSASTTANEVGARSQQFARGVEAARRSDLLTGKGYSKAHHEAQQFSKQASQFESWARSTTAANSRTVNTPMSASQMGNTLGDNHSVFKHVDTEQKSHDDTLGTSGSTVKTNATTDIASGQRTASEMTAREKQTREHAKQLGARAGTPGADHQLNVLSAAAQTRASAFKKANEAVLHRDGTETVADHNNKAVQGIMETALIGKGASNILQNVAAHFGMNANDHNFGDPKVLDLHSYTEGPNGHVEAKDVGKFSIMDTKDHSGVFKAVSQHAFEGMKFVGAYQAPGQSGSDPHWQALYQSDAHPNRYYTVGNGKMQQFTITHGKIYTEAENIQAGLGPGVIHQDVGSIYINNLSPPPATPSSASYSGEPVTDTTQQTVNIP